MVLALAGMVVAVFVNVVLRYVFHTSIVSYEEISRLLFVWLVAVGAIVAAFEGSHLGFDMVTSRVGPGTRKALFWLSQLLIAACMALLLWGSWEQVVAGWNSYSTVLGYRWRWALRPRWCWPLACWWWSCAMCCAAPRPNLPKPAWSKENAMVVTLIFLSVLIGGMVIGMPIAHSLVLTGVALMWYLDFSIPSCWRRTCRPASITSRCWPCRFHSGRRADECGRPVAPHHRSGARLCRPYSRRPGLWPLAQPCCWPP